MALIITSTYLGSFFVDGIPIDSVVLTAPWSNEIVWETVGSPDSLDPHVNYESFGDWIFHYVYETLYTYPWDSAETELLVPLLASSHLCPGMV